MLVMLNFETGLQHWKLCILTELGRYENTPRLNRCTFSSCLQIENISKLEIHSRFFRLLFPPTGDFNDWIDVWVNVPAAPLLLFIDLLMFRLKIPLSKVDVETSIF